MNLGIGTGIGLTETENRSATHVLYEVLEKDIWYFHYVCTSIWSPKIFPGSEKNLNLANSLFPPTKDRNKITERKPLS